MSHERWPNWIREHPEDVEAKVARLEQELRATKARLAAETDLRKRLQFELAERRFSKSL